MFLESSLVNYFHFIDRIHPLAGLACVFFLPAIAAARWAITLPELLSQIAHVFRILYGIQRILVDLVLANFSLVEAAG